MSVIRYEPEKGKYRLLNVNIGDSRIVLAEKQAKSCVSQHLYIYSPDSVLTGSYAAVELSTDHKPISLEQQRIICAGTIPLGFLFLLLTFLSFCRFLFLL
jgi:serine/threonine protein phosphatase PrpC